MNGISINRVNAGLLLALLSALILYFGRLFLIPFAFGILLAMLLLPVSRKLESWGMGRVWSVWLCILLILVVLAAGVLVISAQLNNFLQDLPLIQKKIQQLMEQLQSWVQARLGMDPGRQISLVQKNIGQVGQATQQSIKTAFLGTLGGIGTTGLVLVYVFFLLWKREKYEIFFLRLSREENRPQVQDMLSKSTKVASEYLGGRLVSMLALALFYGIGFSVIGLKNAVLLALVAVIPTIIPYLGPVIGGFFPMAMALTSGEPGMVLSVLIVLVVAQAIDNYFIEPFVLGANLDLSPFVTIVSIIIGEMLWGIAGMILFIPMVAVLKIFFDHIPHLHPYAYLLGEEADSGPGWIDKIKGWFGKGQ
ncbi:MAG: AI-2E family transporter [Adhaeribacter sp.]